MSSDAIKANDVGISAQRQLELIHGSIERTLKAYIIKEYGAITHVHEIKALYESISSDFDDKLNEDELDVLDLLDAKFIIDRYPTGPRFYNEEMIELSLDILLRIKTVINDKILLSKKDKIEIESIEKTLTI